MGKRAGCFALFVFLASRDCSVALPLYVTGFFLQFVIVVFPDHTNLAFVNSTQCYGFHQLLCSNCSCASSEGSGELSRMRGSSEISVDAFAMSTKMYALAST